MKVNFRQIVYMRDRTHTYLWIRDQGRYGHFMTMDSGTIEIVKVPMEDDGTYRVWVDKEHSWELTPFKYEPIEAFMKYHDSHLDRSPEASEFLCNLLKLSPKKPPKATPVAIAAPQKAPRKAEKPAGGGYSLGQLCEELGIDPSEARKTLRTKGVEKPGGRWEWANAEAALSVRKALS